MSQSGFWDINLFAHSGITLWVEHICTLWMMTYLLSKIRITKAAQFAARLPFFDVSFEDGLISFSDFRVEGLFWVWFWYRWWAKLSCNLFFTKESSGLCRRRTTKMVKGQEWWGAAEVAWLVDPGDGWGAVYNCLKEGSGGGYNSGTRWLVMNLLLPQCEACFSVIVFFTLCRGKWQPCWSW